VCEVKENWITQESDAPCILNGCNKVSKWNLMMGSFAQPRLQGSLGLILILQEGLKKVHTCMHALRRNGGWRRGWCHRARTH
jgi:hypothetical protein